MQRGEDAFPSPSWNLPGKHLNLIAPKTCACLPLPPSSPPLSPPPLPPPPFQMMHSQHTDFLSSSLAIEPALQLMFAASTEARGGVECVSVHSLSAERGERGG